MTYRRLRGPPAVPVGLDSACSSLSTQGASGIRTFRVPMSLPQVGQGKSNFSKKDFGLTNFNLYLGISDKIGDDCVYFSLLFPLFQIFHRGKKAELNFEAVWGSCCTSPQREGRIGNQRMNGTEKHWPIMWPLLICQVKSPALQIPVQIFEKINNSQILSMKITMPSFYLKPTLLVVTKTSLIFLKNYKLPAITR